MKNYFLLLFMVGFIACNDTGNKTDKEIAQNQEIFTNLDSANKPDDTPVVSEITQPLPPDSCVKTLLTTIENFKVWKLERGGAIVFKAKLAIDADGSPRAYCPGNKGLDYTANAGKPGNWYGVVTNSHGDPVIQQSTDPFPGCYVSPTTLSDKNLPKDNPLKYCNSEEIPFIVLPKKVLDLGGIRIGDLAYVYNTKNKKDCFALFADGGPGGKLGEGSIYLAKTLGINSNARSGGTTDGIIYVVFPQSGKGNGFLRSLEDIEQSASAELIKIGGKSIIGCIDL